MRSAGAAGYGISTLFSGILVERSGYGHALVLSSILLVTTILLCGGVYEQSVENVPADTGISDPKRGDRKTPRALSFLHSPMYIIWVVMLLLSGLSTSPVGNLKIVILERAGIGAGALGMDGFLGCAVQFVMFFAVSKLEKSTPIQRMMIVSACVITGIAFYMSASSAVMVYMGSMLFYGIFSIINPCTREIVRDCVDENDQTTAIGIADAAQNNISTMISMLYSGFISERVGVNTLLSVCMVMAVATAALCMMLAARSASLSHRGRKKDPGRLHEE